MNELDFSLEAYLAAPLDIRCEFVIESEAVVRSLKKLAAKVSDVPFVRRARIEKTRRLIIRENVLGEFSVKLVRGLDMRAYMKDSGEIYFSLGAIIKRSSLVTLKTFCHELCHLWLSRQSFYPELKAADKEFRTKYKDNSAVYLLSPIEVYAMSLSVGIMRQVEVKLSRGRRRERLRKIIAAEIEKLKAIQDSILKL